LQIPSESGDSEGDDTGYNLFGGGGSNQDGSMEVDFHWYGMVWYGMVPLLPPGPQSLRPSGGSWIGRRLSMLRLSPFRQRLFGDGFRFHRD
jgi:hypothetical protein